MKLNHLFSPTKRSRTQEQSQEHRKETPQEQVQEAPQEQPVAEFSTWLPPEMWRAIQSHTDDKTFVTTLQLSSEHRQLPSMAHLRDRAARLGCPPLPGQRELATQAIIFGLRARERIAANMRNKTIHGGYAEHAYPHFSPRLPDPGLCATSDGRFMRVGPRSLRDLRRDVIHTLDTHGVDTASSVGRFCGNDNYFCLFGKNGGFLWDLRGEAPVLLASLPFAAQFWNLGLWEDDFILNAGSKVYGAVTSTATPFLFELSDGGEDIEAFSLGARSRVVTKSQQGFLLWTLDTGVPRAERLHGPPTAGEIACLNRNTLLATRLDDDSLRLWHRSEDSWTEGATVRVLGGSDEHLLLAEQDGFCLVENDGGRLLPPSNVLPLDRDLEPDENLALEPLNKRIIVRETQPTGWGGYNRRAVGGSKQPLAWVGPQGLEPFLLPGLPEASPLAEVLMSDDTQHAFHHGDALCAWRLDGYTIEAMTAPQPPTSFREGGRLCQKGVYVAWTPDGTQLWTWHLGEAEGRIANLQPPLKNAGECAVSSYGFFTYGSGRDACIVDLRDPNAPVAVVADDGAPLYDPHRDYLMERHRVEPDVKTAFSAGGLCLVVEVNTYSTRVINLLITAEPPAPPPPDEPHEAPETEPVKGWRRRLSKALRKA